MKKNLILLITAAVLISAFVLALPALTRTQTSALNEKAQMDSAPVQAVKQFWEYSLRGDNERAKAMLTYLPPNFWNVENRCGEDAAQAQEQAKKSSDPSKENVAELRVPGDMGKDRWFELVNREVAAIHKEQYEIATVINESEFEDEAWVRVSYGRANLAPFNKDFLLHKETGSWKIFLVEMDGPLINANYANRNCK